MNVSIRIAALFIWVHLVPTTMYLVLTWVHLVPATMYLFNN